MEQEQKCCVCGATAEYMHLGKLYCEPHIAEVTPRAEVWSRVVGYYAPVSRYNTGKKQEFSERRTYKVAKMLPKERIERPDICGCQDESRNP